MKDFIRLLVQMYFVIYTGSMLATLCFCSVFNPQVELDISFLAWIFLFSLLADLPGLVFYSKKELSKAQWRFRQFFHFLLLEIVLLIAGGVYGMYEGLWQGFWFGITVVIVYVAVYFINYILDKQTAELLNRKLQERRKESEQDFSRKL